MVVGRVFVPGMALFLLGAILILVPPSSASLPAILFVPLAAFWLFAWCLDARFTARHWRLVKEGREANVLVLALARIAPYKPLLVLAAHAALSVGAAAGLQALVTHSLDHLVISYVLSVFGILHVEAFYRSRSFVTKMAVSG